LQRSAELGAQLEEGAEALLLSLAELRLLLVFGGDALSKLDELEQALGVLSPLLTWLLTAMGQRKREREEGEQRLRQERAAAETERRRAGVMLEAAERSRRALLDILEEQKLAEDALRASEERYRELVENLVDAIFVIDAAGVIRYISAPVLRMTGFEADELQGRRFDDFVFEEDRDKIPRCFGLVMGDAKEASSSPNLEDSRRDVSLSRGDPFAVRWEFRYLSADGEIRWARASARPTIEDGVVTGFRGVLSDISDRKRAEDALRHRLRYEHLLSEVSRLAVTTDDFELLQERALALLGKGMGVSRAYIFQQSAGGETMDNTFEWCAPGVEPMRESLQGVPNHLLPWWVETLASDQAICFADVEDIPDRATRIMLRPQKVLAILAVPLLVRGRYWGFIGFDDCVEHRIWPKEDVEILRAIARLLGSVRESREASASLSAERAQLLTIFDSIEEPIYVSDPQSYELVFMNRALRELIGENLVGERCHQVLQGLEAPCPFCTNAQLRAAPQQTHRWEFFNPKLVRTFALHDRLIRWPDGREVRLELAVDISEQKRLEAQLIAGQRLEAIGRLAGGIAHDFNNLLAVILSYANFAMEAVEADNPLREDLQEIKEAGERAASLTRQLLAFSRRQVLEPRAVDANELILKLERILHRILGEDLRFERRLASELDYVHADPGQLEQVIMNLVVNARDAMPSGGRLLIETANVDFDAGSGRREAELKAGRYVMLAISDNGRGMDEATRHRIFEPFFSTKEAGKGTGLGLATVYGIVKQSGGGINVCSEPGKGACFRLYFPISPDSPKLQVKQPRAEQSAQAWTVLLVEDDDAVRKVSARMLGALGHRVLTAVDGAAALKLSQEYEGEIGLLLTDVVMPEMSGRELAEAIRAFRPDMRVLYMSGYTENAIVHHGVLDTGLRLLAKPFGMEELEQMLRRVMMEGMEGEVGG
jgi:signal transduction histidine kinase/ActR/RegA family two-component response regulator